MNIQIITRDLLLISRRCGPSRYGLISVGGLSGVRCLQSTTTWVAWWVQYMQYDHGTSP